MPSLCWALAPSGAVDPATLTRAERIQWDGAEVREVLNRRIEDLAAQGAPIKAVARITAFRARRSGRFYAADITTLSAAARARWMLGR